VGHDMPQPFERLRANLLPERVCRRGVNFDQNARFLHELD
jgi:hypothetical protein